MNGLKTYKEATREFGVRIETIADMVRIHGITPKPMPLNGKAKGLDPADMKILRRALGRPARAKATQTA